MIEKESLRTITFHQTRSFYHLCYNNKGQKLSPWFNYLNKQSKQKKATISILNHPQAQHHLKDPRDRSSERWRLFRTRSPLFFSNGSALAEPSGRSEPDSGRAGEVFWEGASHSHGPPLWRMIYRYMYYMKFGQENSKGKSKSITQPFFVSLSCWKVILLAVGPSRILWDGDDSTLELLTEIIFIIFIGQHSLIIKILYSYVLESWVRVIKIAVEIIRAFEKSSFFQLVHHKFSGIGMIVHRIVNRNDFFLTFIGQHSLIIRIYIRTFWNFVLEY